MKTCLVVDDSGVVRKIARRILEGMEFTVVEAEDGAVALEACKQAMPDAVLLDWNMPVMDGFEFLVSKGRALMPTLFDEEITATYVVVRLWDWRRTQPTRSTAA